jgi:uncharacterized lipoprotein
MKKALMAALAVSFIAGCSSFPSTRVTEDTVDHEYMAAIERAATRYGTAVYWVNVPHKRAATQ